MKSARCFIPRARACLALLCLAGAAAAWGQEAPSSAMKQIGRAATPAEIRAWNIDVRGDFKGLPPGSGSVSAGGKVWEVKCASCHGVFGESNEVFTPIVGGTSKKDIEAGRVFFLANPGYPHRTTLMKVSKLSSMWDYINRAMPWNAPKSLTTDEVYGVLAYILNLGDIVPADFTLTDKNIAAVQERLPNRNGKVFYKDMWETRGKGDVKNPLCMHDCPVEGRIESSIPDAARNSNGNIADQVRPFGPARGTDTSVAPRSEPVGVAVKVAAVPASPTGPAAAAHALPMQMQMQMPMPMPMPMPMQASAPDGPALVKANACTSCHAMASKIVGPAFQDVAKKYAGRPDAVEYLAGKIRKGGQGVWGSIPMPEQAQLSESDAKAIAAWLAGEAK